MTKVIDTNHNVTRKLAALKALGIEAIIRYDNRLGPHGEKQVKSDEARAIADAKMRLAIVYEGAGDKVSQFSEGLGYLDAKYSRQKAPERGQPDGSAVYFAVDFDATAGQVESRIIPYFQGVKRAFEEEGGGVDLRVGVYGSGLVCRTVKKADLADLTWISCSMGWAESRAFLAAGDYTLRQHTPKTIAGLDTDPNDINPDVTDIGDFVPWGGTTVAVDDDDPKPTPKDTVTIAVKTISESSTFWASVFGKGGALRFEGCRSNRWPLPDRGVRVHCLQTIHEARHQEGIGHSSRTSAIVAGAPAANVLRGNNRTRSDDRPRLYTGPDCASRVA